MSRPTERLGFGQFFGDVVAEAEVAGVSIRELAGRPPQGIPRHTHESAHFCLIVRGDYETRTRDLTGQCGTSALLFHPAGTTHDDHFRGTSGEHALALQQDAALAEVIEQDRRAIAACRAETQTF